MGPTNNPAAGALSDPCGQPTKVKGEKDIRRKKKTEKRDECLGKEEEQVQHLEVHLSNAARRPEKVGERVLESRM